MQNYDWEQVRAKMVLEQIEARGIRDKAVLDAMRKVPRHLFVDPEFRSKAYEDVPLAIGMGQTISQPYIVALMSESLQLSGSEKVLEIGTGSGYQTAILAELAGEVYSIERFEYLSKIAERVLTKFEYKNIFLKTGDGTVGLGEWAPYERIIVTAGAPGIPDELIHQLPEGGIIIIPVGNSAHQDLVCGIKNEGTLKKRILCGCVFVPLVGAKGWRMN